MQGNQNNTNYPEIFYTELSVDKKGVKWYVGNFLGNNHAPTINCRGNMPHQARGYTQKREEQYFDALNEKLNRPMNILAIDMHNRAEDIIRTYKSMGFSLVRREELNNCEKLVLQNEAGRNIDIMCEPHIEDDVRDPQNLQNFITFFRQVEDTLQSKQYGNALVSCQYGLSRSLSLFYWHFLSNGTPKKDIEAAVLLRFDNAIDPVHYAKTGNVCGASVNPKSKNLINIVTTGKFPEQYNMLSNALCEKPKINSDNVKNEPKNPTHQVKNPFKIKNVYHNDRDIHGEPKKPNESHESKNPKSVQNQKPLEAIFSLFS